MTSSLWKTQVSYSIQLAELSTIVGIIRFNEKLIHITHFMAKTDISYGVNSCIFGQVEKKGASKYVISSICAIPGYLLVMRWVYNQLNGRARTENMRFCQKVRLHCVFFTACLFAKQIKIYSSKFFFEQTFHRGFEEVKVNITFRKRMFIYILYALRAMALRALI